MALKTDLQHFLDDKGQVVELTVQAKMIVNMMTKFVMMVCNSFKKPLANVDAKCRVRDKKIN